MKAPVYHWRVDSRTTMFATALAGVGRERTRRRRRLSTP